MELIKLNRQPLILHDLFSNFFETDVELNNSIIRENIIENNNEYIIEMMLPGIKKQDISVDLEENKLLIFNNQKDSNNENENKYLKFGFKKQLFKKEFHLPENIDNAKISASFEDGILIVSLPKKEIVKTIKKIKIK